MIRQRWCKKLVLAACIGVLSCSAMAGCSKQTDSSEEKEAIETPEPTPVVIDNNEDEDSNLGHWGRAMGSVLLYLNDGNPYYFGGYEATQSNKEGAVRVLSESWGIESREDLLKQIQSLLKEGDRASYLEEAKDMSSLSKKQLKTAMKQLTGTLLLHYQNVKYNWKNWQKKGLLAWDMCRVSHLAQWGYIADYVTLDEAQALLEPAVKKLKKNFDNWEDVQNNWLDGYCLFANVDKKASGNDYINRKTIYETIKEEQPENDILYDDTLFVQEIIPLDGVSYKEIMKEIEPEKQKKKGKKSEEETKDTASATEEPI